MAINFNRDTSKSDDRPTLNIKGATISGARYLSDKVIAFTLGLPGLCIYNMKVVDGKEGPFLSTPQIKGKNDRWNDVCAVFLSDADAEKVIQTVCDYAVEQGEAVDWKARHEVK